MSLGLSSVLGLLIRGTTWRYDIRWDECRCAQASIRDRAARARLRRLFDGRSIHPIVGRPQGPPAAMLSESSVVAACHSIVRGLLKRPQGRGKEVGVRGRNLGTLVPHLVCTTGRLTIRASRANE
jgi:hypothetical protein